MRRHLSRTTAALALTACAFAISAAPALAHEFVSSPVGKTKVVGVGEQVFKLGPFTIRCARAKSTKANRTNESPSNLFFAQVKLTKCGTDAELGSEEIELKTRFLTPVAFEYHANGFANFGEGLEETEGMVHFTGGAVEIKVAAIKCLVFIEEQTIPGRAVNKPNEEYSAAKFESKGFKVNPSERFPLGEQQKMIITDEFNKMTFEYGEGQCESFKRPEEELKNGRFKGQFVAEVVKGDLEYF